jgi:hypothetical protein
VPTQCPRSAHAVPTQCPRSAHAVPTQCPVYILSLLLLDHKYALYHILYAFLKNKRSINLILLRKIEYITHIYFIYSSNSPVLGASYMAITNLHYEWYPSVLIYPRKITCSSPFFDTGCLGWVFWSPSSVLARQMNESNAGHDSFCVCLVQVHESSYYSSGGNQKYWECL